MTVHMRVAWQHITILVMKMNCYTHEGDEGPCLVGHGSQTCVFFVGTKS